MYILGDELSKGGLWTRPEDIALKRLETLKEELLRRVEGILGIKLTGSIADGNFFLLQFKNIYIASDYDILIVLNHYPSEKDIETIKEILSRSIYNSDLENILIENIDIKIITTEYPYKGSGIKVPTIYDQDISISRHLYGGKIIYGEEFFNTLDKPSDWIKRQIIHRIIKRKKIFDIFTELGAYDRVAAALNRDDLREKISELVSRYRDYHRLSNEEIENLSKELEKIRDEISLYM